MLKLSYPTCEIGRRMPMPCRIVWECLTDTTRWPEWGPSVTAVESEDRYIRKGTRGRVRIPFCIWIPFVITDYREYRHWSWRVWGVRATGHRTEPYNKNECMLFFEVPLFAAPYLLVCWIALRRIENLLKQDTEDE